jgi:hypothetical protein
MDAVLVGGVYVCQTAFDQQLYERSPDRAQRKIAIDTLHSNAVSLAVRQNWPRAPFDEARAGVADRNYENEWLWGGVKANPARRLWASILCNHTPTNFTATLVVHDRDERVVVSAILIDDLPDEFVFAKKLGRLRWVSNNVIQLLDKSGSLVHVTTLPAPPG